tara:strand:- start:3754 stop:3999 length:246 start_codon:yes stop_codon:yes gene_type:complete
MATFFLVDADTYAGTDWAPVAWLNVRPLLILDGAHEGSYAVNTAIFTSDSAFEQYRSLLENMPTAQCDNLSDWWPEPDPPE